MFLIVSVLLKQNRKLNTIFLFSSLVGINSWPFVGATLGHRVDFFPHFVESLF